MKGRERGMRWCLLLARGVLEVAPTASRPPRRVTRPSPGFAASDVRARRSKSSACLQGIEVLHTNPPGSHRAQQNLPPTSRPTCARIHETNARQQMLPLHQRLTPDDIEPWPPFPHHLTHSAPPPTSSSSIVSLNYARCNALRDFLLPLAYIQVLARTASCVACIPVRACTRPLPTCSGGLFVPVSRPCCCLHSCTLTYCCMSERATQSLYTLKSLLSRTQPIPYPRQVRA